MKQPLKILYIGLGMLFLCLGAVGVAIPVLPTTPFLLLASFCFAKGSERFHMWFLSSSLYKNHLDDFLKHRSMTLGTKVKLLSLASAMLILSFIMVNNIYARVFLIIVIIYLYYYFYFHIKTKR